MGELTRVGVGGGVWGGGSLSCGRGQSMSMAEGVGVGVVGALFRWYTWKNRLVNRLKQTRKILFMYYHRECVYNHVGKCW